MTSVEISSYDWRQFELQPNFAFNGAVSELNFRRYRLAGRASRTALALGVMTLLVRALIPLGYMPGDMLAGEFVVLCPLGMPVEVMQALHRGHHDHDQDVVDMDQSCPIGTALQPAWISLDEVEQATTVQVSDEFTFYRKYVYIAIVARRYDSRAPPIV